MSLRLIGGMFSGGDDSIVEKYFSNLLREHLLNKNALEIFYGQTNLSNINDNMTTFFAYLNNIYFIFNGDHLENLIISKYLMDNDSLEKENFNKEFKQFRELIGNRNQLIKKIKSWETTFDGINKIIENIKSKADNNNHKVKLPKNELISPSEINKLISSDKISKLNSEFEIEEIEEINDNNSKLQAENINLQSKIKQLQINLSNNEQNNNELEEKIKKLNKEIDRLNVQQKEKNTQSNNKLNSNIIELQTKLTEAENKKEDLKKKIEELSNQLQIKNSECLENKNKINEMKTQLSKKENKYKKEIEDLNNRIEELSNQPQITSTDIKNTSETVSEIGPEKFLKYMEALADEIDNGKNDEQLIKEFKILYVIASCLAIKNESFKDRKDKLRINADKCGKINIDNIENYFKEKKI